MARRDRTKQGTKNRRATGTWRRTNDLGILLSHLLSRGAVSERIHSAGWHGTLWRPRAPAARSAFAPCRASSPRVRDAEWVSRHAYGSMVECVLDHDFFVLVRRGGIPADALRHVCRRSGGGACCDLRRDWG